MESLGGLHGKAAAHAATKKAEGLFAPLLDADEESDERSWASTSAEDADVSVEVERTPFQLLKIALVSVGLGAGVVASAAAMILNPAAAVLVMGGIVIANAPYAAFKEHKITKLPALRSLVNELKEEANDLEDEVDFLSNEIDDLQPTAARAASAEAHLREIGDEQGFNADKFVSLVKENGVILAQTKDNLRHLIVQDVLGIVLSSDKNNDGQFNDVETKFLVLKISIQLQEHGVEFDEGKFLKVMGSRPSVEKTIAIVKRLLPDIGEGGDDPDEEEDEDEETKELYDMFHMSISGGSLKGSSVGSIGGTTIGGLTVDESTIGVSHVHSALGASPQKLKLSLSVANEPPRRKRASLTERKRESLTERKRDSFLQKLDQGEQSRRRSEEPSRKRDKFADLFRTADRRGIA